MNFFFSDTSVDFWQTQRWIVDCRHLAFNEKSICATQDFNYLSTNGKLRGRNNRSHLGPRNIPGSGQHADARSLGFNKSLQHPRQHSTAARRLWEAASEVLPLRFASLCNIPLCQVTHYANALFTVHVTISRHESQWGPGAVASYQEGWRRERERGGMREREQTLWQSCQSKVAYDSLTPPQSLFTFEVADCRGMHANQSTSFREREGFAAI